MYMFQYVVVFQAGNCSVSAVVFPRGLLYTPGPWLLMGRKKPVLKSIWNENSVSATLPLSYVLRRSKGTGLFNPHPTTTKQMSKSIIFR